MTKLWIPSLCRVLALFALAGCGDEPSGGKQKDEPSGRDGERETDAASASLDASSRASDGALDARAPSPEEDDVTTTAPDAAPPTDADARDARTADSGRDAGRRDAQTSSGSTIVRTTIVVEAGETYDGEGKRFVAGPELGDGGQGEGQKPVFKLQPGARLRNVVLGAPAADGIHCHGDALLENIVWEDIGEDALTIKEPGNVELRGGSAQDGEDKVFQINAPSSFRVSDFRARNAGKFIRQNGGTTFKIEVFIDGCDISQMKESIFRTDSDLSTVEMKNTRYSEIGKELFLGVAPANIELQDNVEY